jgi:hypothetical protein
MPPRIFRFVKDLEKGAWIGPSVCLAAMNCRAF